MNQQRATENDFWSADFKTAVLSHDYNLCSVQPSQVLFWGCPWAKVSSEPAHLLQPPPPPGVEGKGPTPRSASGRWALGLCCCAPSQTEYREMCWYVSNVLGVFNLKAQHLLVLNLRLYLVSPFPLSWKSQWSQCHPLFQLPSDSSPSLFCWPALWPHFPMFHPL